MHTELLATKLLIPPLARHVVPRERLAAALERSVSEVRLALVSAPAGYGKTTLLAQWAHATRHDVAWLTCETADNDVARFFRYVVSAWATTWPAVRDSHLGVLLGDTDPDRDDVLAGIIAVAGGAPRHTALVIDDFQLIEEPDIHRSLAFLLDHMPSRLHLVLATREDPPLPLARLRARRELQEIRIEDLQLRRDETATMMAGSADVALDAEQVDALHSRLEGWAAGTQLAALGLRRRPTPPSLPSINGRQRHIADYLREEVLDALPDETRRFLLQTSILDRLSDSLCERVTSNHQSREILERLERANLFLMPLDDSRTWFRYHALFAEVLRDELARHDAEAIAELHRRAARWYLDHDLPEPAFDHAMAGDDADTVVDILNQHLVVKLFSGDARVATRWIEALPRAWYASHPQLLLERAAWELITGRRDAGARTLAEAERIVGVALTSPNITTARISAMRCFIACFSNDLPTAQHHATQAFDALPADDVDYVVSLHHALGDTYRGNGRWAEATAHYLEVLDIARREPRNPNARVFAVHVYGAMADLELRQGHMREAASFWSRAMAVVENPDSWGRFPLPVTGWVYLRIGELHYEWNDLDRARETIAKGAERAELGGDARATIAGKVILARLALTDGMPDVASGHLDEARRLLDDAPFPDWMSRWERCRVELWLARNDLAAATGWCDATLESGKLEGRADAEPAWLAVARVLIHRGEPETLDRAGEALDRLIDVASGRGRSGILVEALALRALAHERRGNRTAALSDLEHALRLAEPEGYVRLFVDLGIRMHWLLGEARRRNVMPGYVGRLIATFGDPAEDGSHELPALSEPLSDRERDVLRLVAAGLTNREIAGMLFVSAETVKTHIGNIYGKLGVHNRVEAIARARSLAIID
jgi:LuxR family transcriptional regulator, maltose regulon positive regulatory protein